MLDANTIAIDITIVTYNSERALPRLLSSLLKQTIDLERLALRITDNGSGDGTAAVVDEFERRDRPVVLLGRGSEVG